MVWYDEECLEFASELQHRARGETVDCNSKVQGATATCARSARDIAEDMCLGPKPVTDRTSTYLGVLRVCVNSLVFTVPTEIPEGSKALSPESEWLAPFEPRGGASHEMGVRPDRSHPSLHTEMVSVGPEGEGPMMAYHGTKIAEWGHVVVVRPVPQVRRGDRGQ